MTTYFFDDIHLAATDEIQSPMLRRDSDHYNSLVSVRGRACCLARVVTHALAIPLKPLYYIGMYTISRQSVGLIRHIPREALENDPRLREHVDELMLLRSLMDNPELVDRIQRELQGMPLCALAAPVSQTVQVFKALAGFLVHPGLYYQHDPFLKIFVRLTVVAKDVGCSEELCNQLMRGSQVVHDALQGTMSNREYYYETFKQDFGFISDKLSETAPATETTAGGGEGGGDGSGESVVIPKARKLALLNILDPRGTKSGINGCAPALGRLLQHIRAHLTLPSDPFDALAHLCQQVKGEAIDRMVRGACLTYMYLI